MEMFKKYRNLLQELTLKNIRLKYRHSWLGVFWSFLQPLLNMIVLSVVFSGIFGRQDKSVICYPIYLFTGRLLFSFFTTSTKQAMTSFRRNQSIIKKIYVSSVIYIFKFCDLCNITCMSYMCLDFFQADRYQWRFRIIHYRLSAPLYCADDTASSVQHRSRLDFINRLCLLQGC